MPSQEPKPDFIQLFPPLPDLCCSHHSKITCMGAHDLSRQSQVAVQRLRNVPGSNVFCLMYCVECYKVLIHSDAQVVYNMASTEPLPKSCSNVCKRFSATCEEQLFCRVPVVYAPPEQPFFHSWLIQASLASPQSLQVFQNSQV